MLEKAGSRARNALPGGRQIAFTRGVESSNADPFLDPLVSCEGLLQLWERLLLKRLPKEREPVVSSFPLLSWIRGRSEVETKEWPRTGDFVGYSSLTSNEQRATAC